MPNISPDRYSHFIETSTVMLVGMNNAVRLQILTVLIEGEKNVTELGELVGLAPSPVSQHLSKLRRAQLVSFRREGHMVYYRCESTAVIKLLDTLDGIFASDRDARNPVRADVNLSA